MSRMLVDFCGEERVVDVGEVLTFGRDADLVIDHNPYLHRVLGRFSHRSGVWFIENVGSSTTMTVQDRTGTSSATIGPRSSAAIMHGSFVVLFAAGPARYCVEAVLEDFERELDVLGFDPEDGRSTLEWGLVELNDDQRLLLTAMCEHRLTSPAERQTVLPSNKAGAQRLGWSISKFNRKLDHLCLKLARHGVTGLHGDCSSLAADRRRRLVDHAIEVGLVGPDDLELLAAPT